MFQQFSDHVYYRLPEYYSDRPTIGFIRGRERSLLFDAGASGYHAREIKKELSGQGLPDPDFVAISHWHWDHSFGLCDWAVPTIASRATNSRLRKLLNLEWSEKALCERVREKKEINFCFEMMKREYHEGLDKVTIVPAQIEFENTLSLDLGGLEVRLIKVGGPHSIDSVICYIPTDGFVFLGDSNGKNLYLLDWTFDINREDELVT